jgi:hypothetical protein
VTACWECNLKKNNAADWQPRVVGAEHGWDGMLAVFKGLALSEPDAEEKRWLKAAARLKL